MVLAEKQKIHFFRVPYALWLIANSLSSDILQFYWQHLVISMTTELNFGCFSAERDEKVIECRYASENFIVT